jgi:hypothetical protein
MGIKTGTPQRREHPKRAFEGSGCHSRVSMKRVCAIHSDRPALAERGANAYCARCLEAQEAALRHVPARPVPRECFVTRVGPDLWRPLDDAGAHFVAHELGLRAPGPRACLAGHPGSLPELMRALRRLRAGEGVRPRDVFVSLDRRRCGVVVAVSDTVSGQLAIPIRGVAPGNPRPRIDDFYRDFYGGGEFYR